MFCQLQNYNGKYHETQLFQYVILLCENIPFLFSSSFCKRLGVQEIFAVQALPARFPEILDHDHERLNDSYVLPDDALADVPDTLRH